MCGRFTLTAGSDVLADVFGVEPPVDVAPRYNIAPSQPLLALRPPQPAAPPSFTFLTWGLVPSWAKDPAIGSRMINARAETVHEKPSFRSAFRRRRCLVPADGYYEWARRGGGTKTPYHVRLASARPFAFAGLWERWSSPEGSEIESVAIVTTEPAAAIAGLHPRMPVILTGDAASAWLNPDADPATLGELLGPFAAEPLEAYPVSRAVNDPRHDDPSCIEPAGAERLF